MSWTPWHVDVEFLPQMADEDRRRYLFVAIDRATWWGFVRLYNGQSPQCALWGRTPVDALKA